MNSSAQRGSLARYVTALCGTASLLAMAAAAPSHAQVQEEVPEVVLITGSLIRNTTAVGAPVSTFRPQDFTTTGTLTTAELFRFFPAANVSPGPVVTQAANIERAVKVNLRGLDSGSAVRSR